MYCIVGKEDPSDRDATYAGCAPQLICPNRIQGPGESDREELC